MGEGSGENTAVVPSPRRGRPVEIEKTLVKEVVRDPSHGVVTNFCHILPGGRKEFVAWVRAAQTADERLREFMKRWDDLGKGSQRCVSLDSLAEAVGLPPAELVALVGAEAMKVSTGLSSLLATAAQPTVVKASIKAAMKRWGFEDRKLLLQSTGFAPVPKGSTTNIQVNPMLIQAGPRPADESGLPPFENDVLDNSKLLHEAECTQSE